MIAEALAPTIEREDRLERRRHRQARDRVVADVRQVREDHLERPGIVAVEGQEVGDRETDPVGDRMPDRVLLGQVQRVRGDIHGQDVHLLERPEGPQRHGHRDRDRAAPRADVHDPERRGALLPDPSPKATKDLADREVDDQLRLRSRDEGPRVDLEGEPVEFLQPADVRNGFAGLAAHDERPVRGRRIRANGCLRVGHDRSPPDPDRVPQQQLGIQPWGLGAGGPQPLGPFVQELARRLPARQAHRAVQVRRRCRPRPSTCRGGQPGRPSGGHR